MSKSSVLYNFYLQDGASEVLGLCNDLDEKLEGLGRVVEKADRLRLKTIENLVEMLTPRQAVEFLIAATELQFGLRGWGINYDRQR